MCSIPFNILGGVAVFVGDENIIGRGSFTNTDVSVVGGFDLLVVVGGSLDTYTITVWFDNASSSLNPSQLLDSSDERHCFGYVVRYQVDHSDGPVTVHQALTPTPTTTVACPQSPVMTTPIPKEDSNRPRRSICRDPIEHCYFPSLRREWMASLHCCGIPGVSLFVGVWDMR